MYSLVLITWLFYYQSDLFVQIVIIEGFFITGKLRILKGDVVGISKSLIPDNGYILQPTNQEVNSMKLFLMGKAGCGKDTVAQYLVDKHGFVKYRLAQAIEDICRDNHGMIDKDRELMIRVGEEFKASFGQDYWLRVVADQVKHSSASRLVISDVRFPYEYDYFDFEGFLPVRILCPDNKRINRLTERDGNPQVNTLSDPTEQQVDDLPSHYSIDNSYTPEGVRQLLADYLKLETEGLYGNLPAIILRLDLSQTFKHLTPRHKYVLWHYFLAGYTQAEIGNWLGVSQRMVSEYIDQVCKRIAYILEGGMLNDTTGN